MYFLYFRKVAPYGEISWWTTIVSCCHKTEKRAISHQLCAEWSAVNQHVITLASTTSNAIPFLAMEDNICPSCNQPVEEPILLQCQHPICSNCVEARFSFESHHEPGNRVVGITKQRHEMRKFQTRRQTVNICCPFCNENTRLVFTQNITILAQNQQLQTASGSEQQLQQVQRNIPEEIFQWVFQFLEPKMLFNKIRFTCQEMDNIVSTSLLSLNCQGLRFNFPSFQTALSKLTQLQQLHLNGHKIEDQTGARFANSSNNIDQLQPSYIPFNQIGDSGATVIASVLSNLTRLQEVHLCGNQIGDTGATAIASAICKLTRLRDLDLSGNCIGDTGATAIATSISNLSHLQELKLSWNKIGDIGATAISEAVCKFTHFQKLDLYGNIIKIVTKCNLKKELGAKLCTNSFSQW